MKVKMNGVFEGAKGESLKGEKGMPLTMRDVCINSLLIPIQGDDEKVKWDKYEVYMKIRNTSPEVELKSEEVVLIKKCIGKTQPQLIMGQAWIILEK